MASKIIILLAFLACVVVALAAPASPDLQGKTDKDEKLETASSYGLGYGIYNGYSGLGYSPYAAVGYPGYQYNVGYGHAGYPGYEGYGHHGYAGYNAPLAVPVYNDYSHGALGGLGYYSGIHEQHYV